MSNFWKQLPKPFFAIAPMADVTDAAFRQIICKYSRHGQVGGGPDVVWTEFVSADGLVSRGREALMKDLMFSENERPIVVQLFSSNRDNMKEASRMCAELGFDGIDINMGCPDRSIEKQGCGSAMIKTPDKAVEIIQAVKDGIALAGKDIPVSVKTRIGYNTNEINTWIPLLLKQNISALSIHARTRKEMSKVPARWEHIKEVVDIRNKLGVDTVIIGNGDVTDISDGLSKAKESGCDGVMIGRALFGNPWLFDTHRNVVSKPSSWHRFVTWLLPKDLAKRIVGDKRYTQMDVPIQDRLNVLVEHSKKFEKLLGDVKHFAIMKKHFKAYVHGFRGSKELRVRLMEEGNTAQKVREIVNGGFSE